MNKPKYSTCPDDGLPAIHVGQWSVDEKVERVRAYTQITAPARRKFLIGDFTPGATFIDPFCSTGRLFVESRSEFYNGSCVEAVREARERRSGFTQVYLGDIDESSLSAAKHRVQAADPSTTIETRVGTALENILHWMPKLGEYHLHTVLLDPFNIGSLDFEMIKALGSLRHCDLIIHFSTQDLFRTVGKTGPGDESAAFDRAIPGWRDAVDWSTNPRIIRQSIVEHWLGLIRSAGFHAQGEIADVVNSRNRSIYWLVLASKHSLGATLWNKIQASVKLQRGWNF